MQTFNPENGLLLWTALAAIMFLIFLAAFINVLKSDFTDSTTKLMWVLVILLVPFIGSIIYFALGGKHKVRISQSIHWLIDNTIHSKNLM